MSQVMKIANVDRRQSGPKIYEYGQSTLFFCAIAGFDVIVVFVIHLFSSFFLVVLLIRNFLLIFF